MPRRHECSREGCPSLPQPPGCTSNPMPFHTEVLSFSGLCCERRQSCEYVEAHLGCLFCYFPPFVQKMYTPSLVFIQAVLKAFSVGCEK